MNRELKDALEILEKEKNIDKSLILKSIKESLEYAYRNYLVRKANKSGDKVLAQMIQKDQNYINVVIDEDSYDYEIFLAKEVIPDDLDIINDLTEVKLSEARKYDENAQVDDQVYIEAPRIDLGHIAIQNSKGLIINKLREQEKSSLYNEFKEKVGTIVTGTVSRRLKNAYNINLGRTDGILLDSERNKSEKLEFNKRIKVYIQEVTETSRGPKIKVSRSDPNLVRKLFEQEVTEIKDGTVVIKSIAREAGSRTKMAVYSYNPDVDAVGSCIGVNNIRVDAVVDELGGEKIDIVNWDEDISNFIGNALNPAKSTIIVADEDNKAALVVVPDSLLSLAIGKEGQNARLAAKLTEYKIDIKSESQAVAQGIYDKFGVEYDHSKFKDVLDKVEQEKASEENNADSNDTVDTESADE
ncbi:MAG: transcription termination/antitermination protein NusA [Lachnospiraceae bacterium]|nr:transcription termination/antitermination protein NusA [Lachnospiraceae bacterium]